MKQFLFLMGLTLLIACTPQRRLARLLVRYPELQRDSVVLLHDTIITPYVQSSTDFTIATLTELLQNKRALTTPGSSNAAIKTGITAVADGARASIVPIDSGRFALIAEQLPDTNAFIREVTVPVYITEIKKVAVPIPQLKIFLMYLGGIFILEQLLSLVVFTLKKFL